jgi:hypothetical protein
MALGGIAHVGRKAILLLSGATGTGAGSWLMWEAKGYTKWTFMAVSTVAATATIGIETTLDPAAIKNDESVDPAFSSGFPVALFADVSLPGPTGYTQAKIVSAILNGAPVLFVRANVTSYTSGTITVWGFAAP